jgi:hypothetical protein
LLRCLLQIGDDAIVHSDAKLQTSLVAPPGQLDDVGVLVLSKVKVGKEAEVGERSMVVDDVPEGYRLLPTVRLATTTCTADDLQQPSPWLTSGQLDV